MAFRHRIPHTIGLYRRTALNLALGPWYFAKRLVPRARALNPAPKTMVLSFDPDETSDIERIPWLLDTLKKHRMVASFAAVGIWVERNPALWKRVLREGHEVMNHTYSHPDNPELNPNHYHQLTRAQRKEEIAHCHAVVKRELGIEMRGFRTPHFGYQHTKDTPEILAELGYAFSTSTLAIDTPNLGAPFIVKTAAGPITEFPLSPCPKHPWALFDSSHAFRGRVCRHDKKEFLLLFERLLDSGVFVNIYLDPQDFDEYRFEDLLAIIKRKGYTTTTYGELLKRSEATRKEKKKVRKANTR